MNDGSRVRFPYLETAWGRGRGGATAPPYVKPKITRPNPGIIGPHEFANRLMR